MDNLGQTFGLHAISLAAVVYGAVLLLATALIGLQIGSTLIPFYALLALVLCYFQMTATLLGLHNIILQTLFWLAFGSSTISVGLLGYQLLIR